MNNIKKMISILLFAMLALSCFFCNIQKTSAKTKKVPKQLKVSEKNLFEGMKKCNYKKMNKYIISGKLTNDNSSEEMVEMMVFLKKKAKRIKYKVISNSVSGKNATAKVQFRYIDCSQVGKLFVAYFVMEQFSHLGEEEYMEGGSKYDDLMKKCVQKAIKDANCKKYKKVTMKIKFKKVKSVWKVKKFDSKLSDIMSSGFISGVNKGAKEIGLE